MTQYIELTEEQKNVAHAVLDRIKTEQVTKCAGAAGTGKSTLVQYLRTVLSSWSVCAFTGKAADVLRRKGVENASTIHSLIYVPLLDSHGNIVLDRHGSPTFILNPDISCDGIMVDEGSMVSKEIDQDLRSFGIPIIYFGDHHQLEPIGTDISLMRNPDFKLEKIHRNAGEIAWFADFIRRGYRPQAFESHGAVRFVTPRQAEGMYKDADQIICGFNKSRVEINRKVRYALGRDDNFPVVGERIICLRNNRAKGLFNGMQGVVEYIYPKQKNRLIFGADGKSYDLYIDPSQFNKEKYDFSTDRNDPEPFDFCSALTCHRCQGDEFNNVFVVEQKHQGWDFCRWSYTAASRAKKSVTWISA